MRDPVPYWPLIGDGKIGIRVIDTESSTLIIKNNGWTQLYFKRFSGQNLLKYGYESRRASGSGSRARRANKSGCQWILNTSWRMETALLFWKYSRICKSALANKSATPSLFFPEWGEGPWRRAGWLRRRSHWCAGRRQLAASEWGGGGGGGRGLGAIDPAPHTVLFHEHLAASLQSLL